MEIDTGSYLSTININEIRKLPNIIINKTVAKAKAYGNSNIKFLGEVTLRFKYNQCSFDHNFLVVDGDNVSLFGRDLCRKLNIKIGLPGNTVSAVSSDILKKYEDYLSDSFQSNVKETVGFDMQPNVTPVFSRA